MSTANFTVADYLLWRLKQFGLDKVFQVPGDYVQEFMTALDNFPGIDAVGDVTELGAGYAAEGYARYRGIGAVSVQYGVGTFSVLNAIAGAYVERNPVVVISASPSASNRVDIEETGVLFHHSTGDYSADKKIFENVTVASEILADATAAPSIIDRALQLAMSEKRPIYLEAWQNVWGAPCNKPDNDLVIELPASEPPAMAALLEKTISRLEKAEKPLVLLGIEVARLGIQAQVESLLCHLNVPYTTSTLAKSVLSETQGVGKELFIGTYAGEASWPETFDFVKERDCILALGMIFTDDYLTMLDKQGTNLIRVNMGEARVGKCERISGINLAQFIGDLVEYIKQTPRQQHTQCTIPKNSYLNTPIHDSDKITYDNFFVTYQQQLVRSQHVQDLNLILGESSSLYMAARLTGIEKNRFVSDAAWGSLGHETGCSLGTGLANPRRSAVIAGDGGFMMMCQTLSTISHNKLNTVVFVMSNQVYAIEQSFVDICAFTPSGEFAPFDKLHHWNYEALAKAYLVEYLNVENVEDLNQAFSTINANQDKSYLIKVNLNKKDLAPAIKDLAEAITGTQVENCPCSSEKGNNDDRTMQ
ncbi:thiamine pyrophosphate-dependent enzyme [Pseudoalteromonas luteoviolacea]|uniref:alpha-keto acid decarboxylase family protein n=1 Tax=Pseudoalteromonas luteoviolacea TaxID=43657 RepID=UPI001EEE5E69|nr:thiamine pyrophosphate-binding protein [Pseudoalteromonas luteoviolacea]MCF6442850.1 thiamine pyrophosphate-dependent enzyme [Pseudoalteromonas luteoviolacea]